MRFVFDFKGLDPVLALQMLQQTVAALDAQRVASEDGTGSGEAPLGLGQWAVTGWHTLAQRRLTEDLAAMGADGYKDGRIHSDMSVDAAYDRLMDAAIAVAGPSAVIEGTAWVPEAVSAEARLAEVTREAASYRTDLLAEIQSVRSEGPEANMGEFLVFIGGTRSMGMRPESETDRLLERYLARWTEGFAERLDAHLADDGDG